MSTILFDQVDPDDDPQDLPAAGSPGENAPLLCGFALRQADRGAAATGAACRRWWLLALNTDPARVTRLNRRYGQAEQALTTFVPELARTMRQVKTEVSVRRYLAMHGRIAAIVNVAHTQAMIPWRVAAAEN